VLPIHVELSWCCHGVQSSLFGLEPSDKSKKVEHRMRRQSAPVRLQRRAGLNHQARPMRSSLNMKFMKLVLKVLS
jgi:hypothetical protein